jgi:hypothetical protein
VELCINKYQYKQNCKLERKVKTELTGRSLLWRRRSALDCRAIEEEEEEEEEEGKKAIILR